MSEAEFSLRSIAVPAYGPAILYSAATGGMLPLVALAARDAGASVGVSAMILTLYSVGSLAMSVPASLITARFGERAALIGSGLVSAAGMSVTGLTTSLWALCVGLFAAGLGVSVFQVARQSFLTVVAPPHMRARALSTLGGMARVGSFTGPFLMAFLLSFTDLRGAFLATAALAALAALLCLAVPSEEALAARVVGARLASGAPGSQRATTPAAAPGPRTRVKDVLGQRKRSLGTIGLAMVLLSAVRQTKYSIVPLWAAHIGLDAQQAAIVVGLSSAADMLLFYPAGRLMDLRGRWIMGVGCLGGMGLSIAGMSLTSGPWTLITAAVAMGLSNGLGSGIAMTLAADLSPDPGRAQFLGLWRLVQESGSLAGPASFALVVDVVSLAAGLWWMALVAFGGVALVVAYLPHRPGPVTPLEERRPA
ncbi:MFS transporter [Falsarthrobacter nasiphocae]|uniref:MFS family permease n=1 Tax=Falsarthrobacter nasiphocae TaxID=189863 RepID=A0AAE3YFF7_9MICC|nr:MFS transporter [Falsarthrobacter nasiphocae]MDR6892424.1 MFS family permease [Falsarthrobacter nasiphocae]